MEPIEHDLTGLDAERPLPPALRDRLEAALLHDAASRPVADDDTAALLGDLDGPLPLPVTTRRALERALIASPRRNRWWVPVAAAAAVLLVLASVAALDSRSTRHDTVAAGPPTTSAPDAGLPATTAAVPTTTGALAGRAVAGRAGPTTTACHVDCGGTADDAATAGSGRAAAPSAALSGQPRPPYVNSVDPGDGPMSGGTMVTVKGAGFTGASGVLFGTSQAVSFTVVSDGEIQALSPPATQPGAVSVAVTFPDGAQTQPGPAAQFTYTAPGP